MSYWYQSKPKLSTITDKPPGLIELLVSRTYRVHLMSTIFHIGMVAALLTGIVLEIMYATTFSAAFQGSAWLMTWGHGLFGIITAIGFIGVLIRFLRNPLFRLAAGKMFYLDAFFITIISASGIVLLLRIIGWLPATQGWMTTLHLTSVITWLLVSLLGEGLVAHAYATLLYRFTDRRSPAAFSTFSRACARCGQCIEICPQYEASNGNPEEAPALKVRRYLDQLRKGASLQTAKATIENIYLCAECGLCVSVCPYSFRHYDLYMELLETVNNRQANHREMEAKQIHA